MSVYRDILGFFMGQNDIHQNWIDHAKHYYPIEYKKALQDYNSILSSSNNQNSDLNYLKPQISKTMYNNYPQNNYGNNRGGYSQNRGNNYPRQQRTDVKKSGAKYSTISKGKRQGMIAVTAWRKTRNGLMVAKGFPVSEEVFTSQSGKEYMRYAVEVTNSSMGTSTTYWCLMSLTTKKLVIKELSLVISPNGQGVTASGKRVTGFFGANYRR